MYLAAFDAIVVVLYRHTTWKFVRANHRSLLVAVAAVVMLGVFSTSGAFGSITAASPGATEDISLAISVLLHALLGCTISIAWWLGGAGVVIAFSRNRQASLCEVLIPAFPTGIALLAILVAVALVAPFGKIVALASWMACLTPLGQWRPPRSTTRSALLCTLTVVSFATAFGVWMGLLWHGPTATLPGSLPSDLAHYAGDLVYYASTSWSLAVHPYPFINLGYESAPNLSYLNQLVSALGATMIEVPGFDPLVFIAAGCGASYVVLTGLMLHLYLIDHASERIGWFGAAILILSVLAAARYPFWVIESPSVVFVPALTIAVWWMTERGKTNTRWALLAMAGGFVGTALTKVAAAVILLPIGGTPLLERLGEVPRYVKLLALVIASVFFIYSTYMLVKYLPSFVIMNGLGTESARIGGLAYICRDVSVVLLAALAYRTIEPPATLVITGGFMTFIAFSALFTINFVCATLLIGLIAFTKARGPANLRVHAILAFLFALPAAVLTDPGGLTTGIVWTLCLGSTTFAAWALVLPNTGPLYSKARNPAVLAGLLAAVTSCVTLAAVASGHIIMDSGWNHDELELTPDVKDIWRAVRQYTPLDCLIFIDQTRDMWSLIGGYSAYVRTGQRQVYLADYVHFPDFRINSLKRQDALNVNDAVLRGTIRPADLATRRQYSSFFAVLPKSRPAPSLWPKVYGNNGYALYQILP